MDEDLQVAGQLDRLRQVVSGLLSASQVERLLGLWRDCQASQAHCSVPGFVDKVAGELQLDATVAGQLRLKLFAEVLARRPAVQRARVGASAPAPMSDTPTRAQQDAAGEVFGMVIAALDGLVNNRHPDQWMPLCSALVRQLRREPVAGFDVGPLLRGERGAAELALSVHGEVHRQALVHGYYLALCEVLGPVPADRLLSEAVRQAEQSPAAAHYAPRRLL